MEESVLEQVARVQENMKRRKTAVAGNVAKAILQACLLVERQAKMDMRNTPTSPSSPGDPPAIDTGRLVASVTHVIEGGGFSKETKGYVGTNVDYGRHLEFGTSTIAPRPWLTPALESKKKEIKALIKEATMKSTKGEEIDEGSDD